MKLNIFDIVHNFLILFINNLHFYVFFDCLIIFHNTSYPTIVLLIIPISS